MVKVTTETGQVVEHADAAGISVEDGHLYVDTKDDDTISIYAPGRWASVVADAPATVTEDDGE